MAAETDARDFMTMTGIHLAIHGSAVLLYVTSRPATPMISIVLLVRDTSTTDHVSEPPECSCSKARYCTVVAF
jgi:hypothetical protein